MTMIRIQTGMAIRGPKEATSPLAIQMMSAMLAMNKARQRKT